MAEGFRVEDGDERGHVPRTAFHVRVSKVKSLLGGSVEEWRLTVQCFLCHISISPRLSLKEYCAFIYIYIYSIYIKYNKKVLCLMPGYFSNFFFFLFENTIET